MCTVFNLSTLNFDLKILWGSWLHSSPLPSPQLYTTSLHTLCIQVCFFFDTMGTGGPQTHKGYGPLLNSSGQFCPDLISAVSATRPDIQTLSQWELAVAYFPKVQKACAYTIVCIMHNIS